MAHGSEPHILLIPPAENEQPGILDNGIKPDDMLKLLELKVHSRREHSRASICIRKDTIFTPKDQVEEVPLYEYLNRRGTVLAQETIVRYEQRPLGSSVSHSLFQVQLKFTR